MWGNPYDDEEAEYEGWVDTSGNPVDLEDNLAARVTEPGSNLFVTKASGQMAEHSDGVVRDTEEGKPRFDLMFPKGIPFEKQLMTRVADLYYRGGKSYGDRNWEKSKDEKTLAHHEAALMRHMIKFLTGVDDGEDHAAAIVWNVNAVDLTRQRLAEQNVTTATPVSIPGPDKVTETMRAYDNAWDEAHKANERATKWAKDVESAKLAWHRGGRG